MIVGPLQVVYRFLVRASPRIGCGRAGFVIDSLQLLHTKPQGTSHNSTVGPYGHALYKHYNNDIHVISAFLKMDAGGGPETVLPLGVALNVQWNLP